MLSENVFLLPSGCTRRQHYPDRGHGSNIAKRQHSISIIPRQIVLFILYIQTHTRTDVHFILDYVIVYL